MGQNDEITRRFWADNARFADILNVGIFHGKQIIKGSQLHSKDTYAGGLFGKLKKKVQIYGYRDVFKTADFGVNFALIGIEDQQEIHYAMPLKVWKYDFLGYEEQLRKIKKMHRRKQDLSGAEYLSGFSRRDKLKPTLTIVLYYGKEPWDGPMCLADMLDWKAIPKEIQNKVVDYPIYVLDVQRFSGTEELCTDARLVFGFLQRHESQNILEQYVRDNQEGFTELEEDAYDMISILTNSQDLMPDKQEYMNERGEVNMCKALEDMKVSAMQKGKQEEREQSIMILVESLRELDVPEEDILRKIEEKYQLNREEAAGFVKK